MRALAVIAVVAAIVAIGGRPEAGLAASTGEATAIAADRLADLRLRGVPVPP